MKKQQSQAEHGFGFLPVLLLIIVIGVIAYLAVSIANKDTDVTDNTVVPATTQDIDNQEDLQGAEESLNDINLEELDTTELDEAEADLL